MSKIESNEKKDQAASTTEAASFIAKSKIEERLQQLEKEIQDIIGLRQRTADHLRKLELTQSALQGEREGLRRLIANEDGDQKADEQAKDA